MTTQIIALRVRLGSHDLALGEVVNTALGLGE
jgi:hypothetical protein